MRKNQILLVCLAASGALHLLGFILIQSGSDHPPSSQLTLVQVQHRPASSSSNHARDAQEKTKQAGSHTEASAPQAYGSAGSSGISTTKFGSLSLPPPNYPLQSVENNETGTVEILIQRTDAKTVSMTISQSSGFRRLDSAALDVVTSIPMLETVKALESMGVTEHTLRFIFKLEDPP